MKPPKTSRKTQDARPRSLDAVVGRRYSSVEAMMIGEKFPKRIINRVRALFERDKAIAHAFRQGASMKRIARKHSLPLLAIEDILRYELALHSPNTVLGANNPEPTNASVDTTKK